VREGKEEHLFKCNSQEEEGETPLNCGDIRYIRHYSIVWWGRAQEYYLRGRMQVISVEMKF
jgi:hypothetical protein